MRGFHENARNYLGFIVFIGIMQDFRLLYRVDEAFFLDIRGELLEFVFEFVDFILRKRRAAKN